MTQQHTPNQAGDTRQFDPEHVGRLHVEIADTIDRFISQYPNTLKSEILEALRTVRVGYENDVYFKRKDN